METVDIIATVLIWQVFGGIMSVVLYADIEQRECVFRRWHIIFFMLHPLFLLIGFLVAGAFELTMRFFENTRLGKWLNKEI